MLVKGTGVVLIAWLPRVLLLKFAPCVLKVSPKARCMIECNQIFVERSKFLHA